MSLHKYSLALLSVLLVCGTSSVWAEDPDNRNFFQKIFSSQRDEPEATVEEQDRVVSKAFAIAGSGKFVVADDALASGPEPVMLEPVSESEARRIANSAAAELNQIERDLEEWGHGSMSGLVLFPSNGEFGVKNDTEVTTYLDKLENHTSGSVDLSFKQETSMETQVAVDTGLDSGSPALSPDGKIPDSKGKPGGSLADLKGATGPNFKPATKAASGGTLSPSVIDKIAASTFVSKTVLNKFSDPSGAASNYVMFMGLAQVSVSPGWRTQKDYFCEIQMRPLYAKETVNGALVSSLQVDRHGNYTAGEMASVEQPSVFSAFPLLDAQVLDQSYDESRKYDMLLEFAGQAFAAGQKSTGRFLLEQHREMTQNVKTRSALPLLVPSSDGQQLTYRFDPSLYAVEEPGVLKSKPATLLKANSVPTLFVLACAKEELQYWSHVSIMVSTRFVPAQKRHLLNQAIDVPRFTYIRGIPYSNRDRLDMARRVSNVYTALGETNRPGFPEALASEMHNRYINIVTLAGGDNLVHELPLPQPEITGISPSSEILIRPGQPVSITGSGFFQNYGPDDQFIELVSLNGVALEPDGPMQIAPSTPSVEEVFKSEPEQPKADPEALERLERKLEQAHKAGQALAAETQAAEEKARRTESELRMMQEALKTVAEGTEEHKNLTKRIATAEADAAEAQEQFELTLAALEKARAEFELLEAQHLAQSGPVTAKAVTPMLPTATAMIGHTAIIGNKAVKPRPTGPQPFELRYRLPADAERLFEEGDAVLSIITQGGQSTHKNFKLVSIDHRVSITKVVPDTLPAGDTQGRALLIEGKFGNGEEVERVLVNGHRIEVKQVGTNQVVAVIESDLPPGPNPIVILTKNGAASLEPGLTVE